MVPRELGDGIGVAFDLPVAVAGQLAHLMERWLLVLWLPLEEYEEELWAE